MTTTKHRRLVATFAGSLLPFLLSSCFFTTPLPQDPEEVKQEGIVEYPYTISKEEAVDQLISTLKSWETADLRASGSSKYSSFIRDLKSIDLNSVYTVTTCPTLRSQSSNSSSPTSETREELVHLINFDDGGYAVASADRRIPSSILAVVDEGQIDPMDFKPLDSLITEKMVRQDIPSFRFFNDTITDCYSGLPADKVSAGLMYDYALAYVKRACSFEVDDGSHRRDPNDIGYYDRPGYQCDDGRFPREPDGPEDPSTPQIKYVSGEWETYKEVPVMIKTQWGQGTPFNDLAPDRAVFLWLGPKKKAPAGCVPLAVSEILTYQKPSNYTTKYGPVDLSFVEQKVINSGYYDDKGGAMVARLLRESGRKVDAIYWRDATFAFPSAAQRYFRELGFQNVERYFLSAKESETIKSLDRDCPVFISAISGIFGGHAWVIDGYRKQKKTDKTINLSTGDTISEVTSERTFVHCNFGWDGAANGFYTFGIFNTKRGPEELSSFDTRGDIKGKYNYTWYISVITMGKIK